MIQKRCHHHAEQQQNIGKYDTEKQGKVTRFVLQDDTQTEPVKKANIRQFHCFLFF